MASFREIVDQQGRRLASALTGSMAVLLATTAVAGPPALDYNRSAHALVLRFEQAPGELAEADRLAVHVWGDGRVEVHRPAWMAGAGDHETFLSQAELQTLLTEIVATGVVDVDPPSLRTQMRQRLRQRANEAAEGGLPLSLETESSGASTIVEVRLDWYEPEGPGGPRHESVTQLVDWYGARRDLRSHPDLPGLQALAATHERFRELAATPQLAGGE